MAIGTALNTLPVMMIVSSARPRLLQTIGNFIFWEPAHWIMQTRQFANLKRRAERESDERDDRMVKRTGASRVMAPSGFHNRDKYS